jgi:hypothetical protein
MQQRDQLRSWALGLLMGGDSPLSPGEKINVALDEYQRALSSGNAQQFQSAAQALWSQSSSFYASGEGGMEIKNRIIADAQRLGGFSISGFGDTTVASIDQLRSSLLVEFKLAREDNQRLRNQVNDLISSIRSGTSAQTQATASGAQTVAKAVIEAVESLGK